MADIPQDISTTARITIGGSFAGSLEQIGDRDWIRVNLIAGQTYSFAMGGTGSSPVGDSYLRLYSPSGNLLAGDDDSGPGYDSLIRAFRATTTGTYFVEAAGYADGQRGDYRVRASTARDPVEDLPVYSLDQIARQLTDGFWQGWGGGRRSFDVSTDRVITVSLSDLNAAGRSLAIAALDAWEDVTGLTFREVTENADIDFTDRDSGAYSTSDVSGTTITGSLVNVDTGWLDAYGTSRDSYSYQTYIHEIGHALGLGHAGNYNGFAVFPGSAQYRNDSWQASVMSYFSQAENSYINGSYAYVQTPMAADILAVQELYGLSDDTRSGNTIYGQGSTAGIAFDPGRHGEVIAFTVFDTGGIDVLNGAETAGAQRIDLGEGSVSDMFGLIGTVSIAVGTVIEQATGGRGHDLISGQWADNLLRGGEGDDTLLGLSGDDVLVGQNGTDRIAGSLGADVILGGSGADLCSGGDGKDRLNGGAGRDRLVGGAEADVFMFTAPADSVGSGEDVIADFESGVDVIDLRGIDTRPATGDQGFRYIDGTAFSGSGGEVRRETAGSATRLLADLDGDGVADLSILLLGTSLLRAGDFNL